MGYADFVQENVYLVEAVLAALRPRTLGEAVRAALIGGWSAAQVVERLSEEARSAGLAAFEGEPIVQDRRLRTAVHAALVELAVAGRVKRRVSRYGVELRSKGHRHAVVDVFRLT